VQYRRSLGICLAGAGLFALMPATVLAQSAPIVSRPVVQSLPSGASQKLNAALARLARDPRDVSAFVDAGDAASEMGDLEAAVGFYRRAEQFAASDPRVKAGLAHALVLQGKPADAIPLFAQADVGGAGSAIAADRGLAYDLVGDTATAQRYYRSVLAQRDDDEARRRLGISLAIAGDEAGSEAMLMPLLRKQDKPAWRAHAFAQAIAGKTTEAVSTVNAILPGTLAQSVSPYLRYMPRLTAAQQAAAANLGKFPRASEIGHDDPAIAAFAPAGGARLASADAALIPQGKPLGSGRARGSRADAAAAPTDSRSTRRSRAEIKAEAARLAANTRVAPPDPVPAIARDTSADSGGELPPIGGAPAPAQASVPALAQASTPTYAPARPTSRPAQAVAGPTVQAPPQRSALAVREPIAGGWQPAQTQRPQAQTPQAQSAQAQTSLVQPLPASAATPTPASRPSVVLPQEAGAATPSRAAALASATPPPSVASSVPSPGFDLTRLGAGAATTSAAATPAPAAASTPASSAATLPAPARNEAPPPPATLAQIFADLGTPTVAAAPVAGAVDIRTIAAVKPPVKPQPKVRLPEVTAAKAEEAAEDEPKTPAGRKAALAAKGVAKTPAEKAALAKKGEDAKDAESADAADTKKGTAKTKADARKLAAKDAEADAAAGGKTAAAKKAADAKKKAEAKKAASHPSRIWVQVGVGRSTDAIAFDWRKSVKQAPVALKGRTPYVSDMGRTNRILVGPFESQKAASAFLGQAKKADFGGAFVWTSQAGQVVDPLPLK
jgi:tetratricopeptide (TPR) repeat protein